MTSVIFVHGTGVREVSYGNTLKVIKKELDTRKPDLQIVECLWGEVCGAKLRQEGASIPTYASARGIERTSAEDEEAALWQFLYQDPFFELRLLAMQKGANEEIPPHQVLQWRELKEQMEQFEPCEELKTLLANHNLAPFWADALRDVIAYIDGLTTTNAADMGQRVAIARAIVAQILVLAAKEGVPYVDGPTRDAMVKLIVTELGGQDRGVLQWVSKQVSEQVTGLALRFATQRIERKRGVISDEIYPAAGDVVLYQTRGEAIRQFIRQRVEQTPGPVYLLAHSLGGIACVDLLVMAQLPNVAGLITAGSQAPLLYELDSLTSLRYGQKLPAYFPKWLNFYDPHDFLSYIGAALFPTRVRDVEVESGQPFPQSHSAYWNNPLVWQALVEFLA